MKESEFYSWGKFKAKGNLSLVNNIRDKYKLKLGSGSYEILACSYTESYGSRSCIEIAGILIKKENMKSRLSFCDLKKVKRKFVDNRNVSIFDSGALTKIDKDTYQDIKEATLSPPKSRQLIGDEAFEYGWFEFIHISKAYISCLLAQYDGQIHVYQSEDAVLILSHPLGFEASFHKSKSDFFAQRADMIRKNYVTSLMAMGKLLKYQGVSKKEMRTNLLEEKRASAATEKMLDDKISELFA